MGLVLRKRLSRLLLRVALALAVGCVFAPSQAHASCGDYVHVGSDSEQSKPSDNQTPQQPKRQQPPCHGPSCSGMPSSLPLASSPSVPVREREWAALAFPTLLPEPCPLDVPADCPGPDAVRHSGSVFHPPR
jgi:hypothetical protein